MIYFRYFWYVLKHKWFVGLECFKVGLFWCGIKHDWSKFLPSEFIPYARYFYGSYPSIKDVHGDQKNINWTYREEIELAFDRAWLLHQKRNSHHWQYFVLIQDEGEEKPLAMPTKDYREMLCDWRGAYRAYPEFMVDALTWYEKNGDKMRLNKYTRKHVEAELRGNRERRGNR